VRPPARAGASAWDDQAWTFLSDDLLDLIQSTLCVTGCTP
jgi:hypothetical protein